MRRVDGEPEGGVGTASRSRRDALGRLLLASLGIADAVAASEAEPAASPWSAPASTAVDVRELVFVNAGVSLRGTLHAPRGRGGVPAVVVAHAASSPTRDLPLYGHLIELLPPLGIAVFVYDRRGSGASGGDLAASDYPMLADDAIAAQKMLAAQAPLIDPRRIGFWGLSQGGWLAVLAGARSASTAFVVSVSAPMTTPDVQMNFAVANILRVEGYAASDIEQALGARRAVDAWFRGELDRAKAQQALDAASARPWFDRVYLGKTLPPEPRSSGWEREMRHDPLSTLVEVRAPTLVVYGAADPWVPVRLSVERLANAAARMPHVETVVIAGADHAMMLSADAKTQMDPASFPRQAPEASAYFGLLGAWLARHGMTERR